MPAKLTLAILEGLVVEITGDDNKELIKDAEFWGSLPNACPICGASLRFTHRKPGKDEFHGLECSGPVTHETSFGKRQDEEQTLYYKGTAPYKNPTKPNEPAAFPWKAYDPERNERRPVGPAKPPGAKEPAQPRRERQERQENAPQADWKEGGRLVEGEEPPKELFANEVVPDGPLVQALLSTLSMTAPNVTRRLVENGAFALYKTRDLNTLNYQQVRDLQDRINNGAKAKGN